MSIREGVIRIIGVIKGYISANKIDTKDLDDKIEEKIKELKKELEKKQALFAQDYQIPENGDDKPILKEYEKKTNYIHKLQEYDVKLDQYFKFLIKEFPTIENHDKKISYGEYEIDANFIKTEIKENQKNIEKLTKELDDFIKEKQQEKNREKDELEKESKTLIESFYDENKAIDNEKLKYRIRYKIKQIRLFFNNIKKCDYTAICCNPIRRKTQSILAFFEEVKKKLESNVDQSTLIKLYIITSQYFSIFESYTSKPIGLITLEQDLKKGKMDDTRKKISTHLRLSAYDKNSHRKEYLEDTIKRLDNKTLLNTYKNEIDTEDYITLINEYNDDVRKSPKSSTDDNSLIEGGRKQKSMRKFTKIVRKTRRTKK